MIKLGKKTVLLLLLAAMAISLSACGKLSGKYYLKDSYGVQYLEFDGDQVTISTFGIPIRGTYRIKGNQIRYIPMYLAMSRIRHTVSNIAGIRLPLKAKRI